MDQNDSEIGVRLIQFRKSLGLSQLEMAEKAGVNRVYITQIETGKTNPSYNVIYNFITKCNLSIDWLITGNGDMQIDMSESIASKLLDFYYPFIYKLSELPRDKQKRLIKIFTEILETN